MRAPRSCRRWQPHRASATSFPPRPPSSTTAASSRAPSVEDLLGEFRTALDGLDVELELAEPPLGGSRSPFETPLRDALAEWVEELEPGALLVPDISTGFTDAHFLRESYGTIAYGFFPLRYTAPGLVNTIHAPDERIDIRDLELAVRSFVHCIDRIGSVVA